LIIIRINDDLPIPCDPPIKNFLLFDSLMNSIIGISSIAEWRFGTDIMDLYRMMRTRINQIDVSEKFVQLFDEKFSKNIDSLQSVFDESHFCSEIHLVGRKLNK